MTVGPWPTPCPIPPGARAALWADGSLAARVAAAWLGAGGVEFVEVAHRADDPAAPGGWGPVHAAAAAAGATWLVAPMPWPGDAGRWVAAEQALRASGMGIWRPFALLDGLAVARLGLALGVEVVDLADRKVLSALGLPGHPSAPPGGGELSRSD